MRGTVFVLLSLLLLSLIPGVSNAQVPSLRVGTVLPVTGALDIFGPTIRLAVDLAANEINAAGGVLGQDITVIHEDSQTSAAAGVAAATKLINVDGVQAIIGALASSVSMPINEGVTTPGRVVQVSPASTSPAFTDFNEGLAPRDRFFFRTAPSDALQGAAAALYAFNTKGWRDMAILTRADPYGSGLAQVFQDTFVALGGTITQRVDYDTAALVFDTELSLIFDSNPQAIWWIAFPGEGELIMQQWWANPAWRGPAWLWSEGTRSQAFVDTLVAAAIGVEGMEGTAPIANIDVADNLVTFQNAFAAANPGVGLVLFEPRAFDALYLVALAAVAREAIDSMSIRDSLIAVSSPPGTVVGPGPQEFARAVGILESGGNIDYEGASGFVNFNLVGDVGSDYEIWRISAAGQIEHVVRVPEAGLRPETPGITAPTASFTVTPASGDTRTPFTVDASTSSDAEDPVTALEVQWDWEGDGVWDTTWTGQKTAEHQYASPGTYTIRMKVRDTGTLMDSTTRQVEVASPPPDSTNPTLSITSPAEGASLASTSVTVSGTASDDVGVAKVELSTDAANWVLATGTTSWSGTVTLTEGPNTIFARATDTSGNAATVSIAVTVDPVSPLVSITSPADGSNLASPSVTVFGTASDDVGVAKVELSTDGTTWVLATGTASWFSVLILAEGETTIIARATDTSGNAATVSITVTVVTPTPGLSPLFLGVGIGAAVAAVAAVAALLILRSRGRRKGGG